MIKIIDLLIDLLKKEEKEDSRGEGVPLTIEAPSYEEKNNKEEEDDDKDSRVIIIDL
jgi:hypothetical protein